MQERGGAGEAEETGEERERGMTKMKMFVWTNPYAVSYGNSLLLVVAKDEESARELAAGGKGYVCGGAYERDEKGNAPMTGAQVKRLPAPDRVLDLPCAEWYEWSE